MGWYSRFVFPWLCDRFLNNPIVAGQRRELLAQAHGEILEIGLGTGLNLPYYPGHVQKLTTVDPNAGMYQRARKKIDERGIAVDHRIQSGEKLPFEPKSFDCVVSTFTLCSIQAVSQTLSEIHRVLRPEGRFLFLEHGLSPEPGVQKWQRRLNWLQSHIGDGCRLDRNIKQLVADEHFSFVDLQERYLEKTPKTHGYVYCGVARK